MTASSAGEGRFSFSSCVNMQSRQVFIRNIPVGLLTISLMIVFVTTLAPGNGSGVYVATFQQP